MNLEEKLLIVLNGDKKKVNLRGEIPSDIDGLLTTMGYECITTECNGWQHDFWWEYRDSKGQAFMYSGGWFDGKNTFSIKE